MLRIVMTATLALGACADGEGAAPTEIAAVAAEETPMTSPALTEVDALVGDWTVDDGAGCQIRLGTGERERIAGAVGMEMMAADVTDCAGLDRVRGWRPIPMGLELTDEGGMAVAVFERSGDAVYRSTDGRFSLRRP